MSKSCPPGIDINVEFVACASDPVYFCNTYGVIDNTKEDGTVDQDEAGFSKSLSKVPFHLWPYQVDMMDKLLSEKRLLLLKARQLGMSWVVCAYALWLCLFNEGRYVLILSMDKLAAQEMIRRIKVLYERLPAWLRERLPSLKTEPTLSKIEWSNDSRAEALAATADAGSSRTISLLIMDEFAKMRFPDDTYTAVMPTVGDGGRAVIISTAKGIGNLYHDLCMKALEKKNEWHLFFLPWHVRPDRGPDFREREIRNAKDRRKVLQEYPENPEEAFLASGSARFDIDWIRAQRVHKCDPLDIYPYELRGLAEVQIFKLPERGKRYVIGGDPAGGNPGSDPSVAQVLEAETWEQVAVLQGQIEPTTFGQSLCVLGRFYNWATLVVLRQNHGHATIAECVNNQLYPNVAFGPDRQYGWPETVKWKPLMIDDLADALKDNELIIHCEETLVQLAMYQTGKNGKTSAPEGMHDDHVSSLAAIITHHNRPAARQDGYVPPSAAPPQQPRIGRTYTQNGYNGSQGAVPSAAPRFPAGVGILPFRRR